MEKRLLSKQELSTLQVVPEGIGLVAIKFVSVGPNKQTELGHSAHEICEFVEQQPVFFIINQSSDTCREILHQYVDRFCDIREGKS